MGKTLKYILAVIALLLIYRYVMKKRSEAFAGGDSVISQNAYELGTTDDIYGDVDAEVNFQNEDQSGKQYWTERILGYGAWSKPWPIDANTKGFGGSDGGWRPYYYSGFPMEPVWLPARPASLDKERKVVLKQIKSPECKLYAEGRCKDAYYKNNCKATAYGRCVANIYA